MSNNDSLPARIQLGEDLHATFKTADDFSIWAASLGPLYFGGAWVIAYPNRAKEVAKQWEHYSAENQQAKLPDILQNTPLSDGRTLADFVVPEQS